MNILDQFIRIRRLTEVICHPLETEDYVPQPFDYASPPKWHLAHTTWFFEKMILSQFDKTYVPFNPDFDFLFNSYYETIGDHVLRSERGGMSRPTVKETYEYRAYVNKAMKNFLSNEVEQKALALIELGLNHEQQHQELLWTDIKTLFGAHPLLPKYAHSSPEETTNQGKMEWVKLPEGIYKIGNKGEQFCYDNELNRHKVYLHEFEICSHLVTNQEYIEFIEDGGYATPRLWHSSGWRWVKENHIEMPLYWFKKESVYFNFTLGGVRAILPHVQLTHVNYYEAYAFARWKKMRLPTEFEWEAAQSEFHWGSRWEWTESAYLPYPGFKQAEDASGEYNGKFMVSQKVLRGASIATPEGHSRPSYRNYFYPHENWQFTGIRLVK